MWVCAHEGAEVKWNISVFLCWTMYMSRLLLQFLSRLCGSRFSLSCLFLIRLSLSSKGVRKSIRENQQLTTKWIGIKLKPTPMQLHSHRQRYKISVPYFPIGAVSVRTSLLSSSAVPYNNSIWHLPYFISARSYIRRKINLSRSEKNFLSKWNLAKKCLFFLLWMFKIQMKIGQ